MKMEHEKIYKGWVKIGKGLYVDKYDDPDKRPKLNKELIDAWEKAEQNIAKICAKEEEIFKKFLS